MPSYITKLTKNDVDYYFDWSTVVDAPVTPPMTKEQYTEWYGKMYGIRGLEELDERMARVEKNGTSASWCDMSAAELISCNRAGEGETDMSLDEIIEQYLP